MDIIEVKGYQKSFGTKIVHKDVNFTVKKGECFGLLGGSGSGKSVILRSLIGLEKPNEGSIFINGQDIVPLTEDQLVDVRKKVAYVFQGGALFDSMNVQENLSYPLREHTTLSEKEIREKISKTLGEFGLAGSEKLMPASLSGGMQKRVGLLRAIIMGPEIVLYDEPTAGLDPFNTKIIQESILVLKKQGVTSILVTHDMPTAYAVCDRMALLMGGSIAAQGSTKELAQDKNNIIQKFINGEKN